MGKSSFERPKSGDELIDDYENGKFVRLEEALMIEAEEVARARRAMALGTEATVAYLLGEDSDLDKTINE